ncbi:hypothetical protein ABZ137_39825 [Streptomyces bobili]|uniref:hypothetical protein n=1 Tax=Streptomyces bobili TaxID=67280 RepID=UPI0033A64C1E
MSDIDRVHQRVGRVDAPFFSISGGPLISVSTGYIARLRDVLDGCTYGDRVEHALHGAIPDGSTNVVKWWRRKNPHGPWAPTLTSLTFGKN